MANLFQRLRGGQRSNLSLDQWANYFTFQGLQYAADGSGVSTTYGQPIERLDHVGTHLYKQNGVVFACMAVRQLVFAEARFQYRVLQSGRPGKLYGNQDLKIFEQPWPNGTTGDLLSRMILWADLGGNAYVARRPAVGRGGQPRLVLMRPDWVDVVLAGPPGLEEEPNHIDARVVAYVYWEGGRNLGKQRVLDVSEVAHFAPMPDPNRHWMGMSWLTPIIGDIQADHMATVHKSRFYENGATPNMVVKVPAEVKQREAFRAWVDEFKQSQGGLDDAYSTLYLGAGADATVVGTDLRQLDLKASQGTGETRIAAAAGVPPVIVGLSEGLQAATYSNYSQARRRFSDGTMRPLWRNVAGSLAKLAVVPSGAELWYDDRDIPFLQEDQKDEADVLSTKATAIKALTDAGYEWDSVVAAIDAGDLTQLKHTGMFSVQLQPPGTPMGNHPTPGQGAPQGASDGPQSG